MYLVIDVETTGKNKGEDAVGDFPASPFYVDNRIVCEAYKYEDESCIHFDTGNFDGDCEPWSILRHGIVNLVVGHNIGFDLHYLRKTFPEWARFIESDKIRIWDTQKAEYVLSGMSTIMPDLDECALKYGGTIKDDRIKKFFKNGGCASELPLEVLRPYNESDVRNTEIIYLAQYKEAEARGLLPILALEMESVLSTNEMEWNGMAIDSERLHRQALEIEKEKVALEDEILEVFRTYLVGLDDININSGPQLSAVLFGGSYNVDVMVETGRIFKTGKNAGKPQLKKGKEVRTTTGLGLTPDPKWESTKKGVYLTNEEILKAVATECEFAKRYLALRALNKDYTTYYVGLGKLVWPQDTVVRSSINQSVTRTGRLSSSDPNLQNTPRGDKSTIKDCFVSRYGEDGYIVEGDYSQLEVMVQAILANDEAMKEDIRNGTDFHALRLSYQLGLPYQEIIEGLARGDGLLKQGRTEIKTGFSFPRAYGAGAKSISLNTGLGISVVQGIIDEEERRYHQVVEWANNNFNEVTKSRVVNGFTKNGYPRGIGKLRGITGKDYTFYEYDTPDFLHKSGKYASFKPTEIKNYPVQGFAYEIIAAALSLLRPKIVVQKDIKLINTVHDSILLDCRKNMLDFACQMLYNSMYGARAVLEKLFSLDFGLDLGVEIKYGRSWYQTKLYEGGRSN